MSVGFNLVSFISIFVTFWLVSVYENPFKEPHRGWSSSGSDLVPLILILWDGSDIPHEITEQEHAHGDTTCSNHCGGWKCDL